MTTKNSLAPLPEDEAVIDKEFINQIGNMFESLHKMLEDNLPIMESEAKALIVRKERDSNKVMYLMDHLLGYTMHGVGDDLYIRLVDYLRTIDAEAANDYMLYYQEQQEEE